MLRIALVLVFVFAGAAAADEKDDEIARKLAAVLRDPRHSLRIRTEAARALGKMGPRAAAAVPDLIQQLEKLRGAESELLQEAVIETLAAIGSPARDALPALARSFGRSQDLDLALKRTSDILINASDARDVVSLIRQLRSPDASLRLRAAKALGVLRGEAVLAVPALLKNVADADADVRRATLVALRLIQPDVKPTEEILKAIALDLKDPDDGVRLLTAKALGKFGPDAAVILPALEATLTDPDKDVRKAVFDAMNKISPP